MISENQVIKILKNLVCDNGIASHNLQDDVASFTSNNRIILSTDSVVENWHYLPNTSPFDIGWKLLARNLSDLASKGATPTFFLLNIFLTSKQDEIWMQDFTQGISSLLTHLNIKMSLIGGDTTISGSDKFIATMTVFGQKHPNDPLPLRQNALPAHNIHITGKIGAAFLGYCLLTQNHFSNFILQNSTPQDIERFKQRYLRPIPLIQKGIEISKFAIAMMDTSDGIADEIAKFAPHFTLPDHFLEDILLANNDLKQAAIHFGDDYELLYQTIN